MLRLNIMNKRGIELTSTVYTKCTLMLAYALCMIVHFDVDICTFSMHLKNTASKVNAVQVQNQGAL